MMPGLQRQRVPRPSHGLRANCRPPPAVRERYWRYLRQLATKKRARGSAHTPSTRHYLHPIRRAARRQARIRPDLVPPRAPAPPTQIRTPHLLRPVQTRPGELHTASAETCQLFPHNIVINRERAPPAGRRPRSELGRTGGFFTNPETWPCPPASPWRADKENVCAPFSTLFF
jgi:hypothetical protein